ncbi:MAG: type II toxin-antitoxin system RelE/ParE family toxin [Candidatus Sungiibacteriota bacterium]
MNLGKNWRVKIDASVYKVLRRFPKADAERILLIIEDPSFNPYEGDIEKIKGEEHLWRRRIGAYRIFFEIYQHESVVHIFRAERRTSHTY